MRETTNTKRYWVYILASAHDTVLYVGITGNIKRRVREHKAGAVEGFTQKYNVKKLVYLEEFSEVEDAIYREKQLKNWKRSWKEDLIRRENPDFLELFADEPANPEEIPHRGAG